MPGTQLQPATSRLLSVESATAFGHTTNVTVLEPVDGGPKLDNRTLRAEVTARLAALPMLRKVLVEVPLGLDRPWWADDAHFDLRYHLRYIAVPNDDDPAALEDLIARIHSRPLDRNRPLWELYLITGLEDGRVALLSKVHMALIDESSSSILDIGLIGPEPELLGGAEPTRWRPKPQPSMVDLCTRAGLNAVFEPARSLGSIPRQLASLPGLRPFLNPALALLNQRNAEPYIATASDTITPRTSFNGRVGPHRRWARIELDMDRIAAIRRHRGVSNIDVLATVAGGVLRWWLLEHDELPRETLKALVPLSVTDPDAVDGIAGALIDLQTEKHRPEVRLDEIHRQIGLAVVERGARSAAEISMLSGGTPLVGMLASRLLDSTPLADRLLPPFNTAITSVPGPTEQLYALGARVVGSYPIFGVIDGMGLHIGAMSLGDRLCLSLVADRQLVPDLRAVAARFETELARLEMAVGLGD